MSTDQMSSSTRFIQSICHAWENMELTEYNFLLATEVRRYFACTVLATVTRALIAHLKSYKWKITHLISTRMPTIIKYGVCGRKRNNVAYYDRKKKRVRLHAIHGQLGPNKS